MQIPRLIPAFLIVLLFLPSLVFAQSSQITRDKIVLQGSGVVVVWPDQQAALDFWLYPEPKEDLEPSAGIRFNAAGDPSHIEVYTQREEENPDAGWFDNKTKIVHTVTSLPEYITSAGANAFFILEDRGPWLKVEGDWLSRKDLTDAGFSYIPWSEAIKSEAFPEFALPSADADPAEFAVEGEKIEDLRKKAFFAPLAPIGVKKERGGAQNVVSAHQPLRFTIMEEMDGWYKVFVVQSACDAASGKTNYLEGTSGWIPTTDNGRPIMIRMPTECQ